MGTPKSVAQSYSRSKPRGDKTISLRLLLPANPVVWFIACSRKYVCGNTNTKIDHYYNLKGVRGWGGAWNICYCELLSSISITQPQFRTCIISSPLSDKEDPFLILFNQGHDSLHDCICTFPVSVGHGISIPRCVPCTVCVINAFWRRRRDFERTFLSNSCSTRSYLIGNCWSSGHSVIFFSATKIGFCSGTFYFYFKYFRFVELSLGAFYFRSVCMLLAGIGRYTKLLSQHL